MKGERFAKMFGNEFKEGFPRVLAVVLVIGSFLLALEMDVFNLKGGIGFLMIYYGDLIAFAVMFTAFRSFMDCMRKKRFLES